MKILSTLSGLLKDKLNGQKTFHKNLFLDSFDDDYIIDSEIDSDIVKDFDKENEPEFYEEEFETNSEIYELKHLPVPLTGKTQIYINFN